MTRIKLAAIAFMIVSMLSAIIAGQQHRLTLAQQHATAVALRASNIEAHHDTTHAVAIENPAVARLLRDSMRLFERRVVQTKQERDALDSALARDRAALYSMRFAFDSLARDRVAASRIDSTAQERTLSFHVRQEPFTVDARVDLPPAITDARLSLRATIDTVSVSAKITCGKRDADGVRAAYLSATTPPWATLHFDAVQQDVAVCGTSPPPKTTTRATAIHWIPLALGVGRSLNTSSWTLFLGSGIGF